MIENVKFTKSFENIDPLIVYLVLCPLNRNLNHESASLCQKIATYQAHAAKTVRSFRESRHAYLWLFLNAIRFVFETFIDVN